MASDSGFTMHSSKYKALNGLYFLGETLDSSIIAEVKMAIHALTKSRVVIKIVDRVRFNVEKMMRAEIGALKELSRKSHQNIYRLFQVIETKENYFLVLEFCKYGDLDQITFDNEGFDEHNARVLFRQMVAAIAYLHSQGYVHRDVKLDNFLLDEERKVRLIDFGHVAKPEEGITQMLDNFNCGTDVYKCPELATRRGYRGTEVDVWSLGVSLYYLLTGSRPFDDDVEQDQVELYRKISEGKYDVPDYLSPDSVKILEDMLQVDPRRRCTVSELLEHPWVTKNGACPVSWERNDVGGCDDIDDECVMQLAAHCREDPSALKQKIAGWNYDYYTASYLLLLRKKRLNRPAKLNKSLGGFPVGYVKPPSKKSSRVDRPSATQSKKKKYYNIPETPSTTQTSPDQPTHGASPPADVLNSSSQQTTSENKPPVPNPLLSHHVHAKTHNALSRRHQDSRIKTHNALQNVDTNVSKQRTRVAPSRSVGSGGCKDPRARAKRLKTTGRYAPY